MAYFGRQPLAGEVVLLNQLTGINGTQDTFNHRAKMCSLAAQGKWSENIEKK